MGEKTGNTNLASEFYVLSMLYRLGVDAYLTLGNKKSVDIVVVKKDGKQVTVDVKGLRDKSCFPIDNLTNFAKNHFVVFVSFVNKIDDPSMLPEVYIVPSVNLYKIEKKLDDKSLVYSNPKGNRKVVQLSRLRKLNKKYLNNWGCLK